MLRVLYHRQRNRILCQTEACTHCQESAARRYVTVLRVVYHRQRNRTLFQTEACTHCQESAARRYVTVLRVVYMCTIDKETEYSVKQKHANTNKKVQQEGM